MASKAIKRMLSHLIYMILLMGIKMVRLNKFTVCNSYKGGCNLWQLNARKKNQLESMDLRSKIRLVAGLVRESIGARLKRRSDNYKAHQTYALNTMRKLARRNPNLLI